MKNLDQKDIDFITTSLRQIMWEADHKLKHELHKLGDLEREAVKQNKKRAEEILLKMLA